MPDVVIILAIVAAILFGAPIGLAAGEALEEFVNRHRPGEILGGFVRRLRRRK